MLHVKTAARLGFNSPARVVSGCVAACAALMVSIGPAAIPAQADDIRANLISVHVQDLTVSSPSCRYTPMTVQWSIDPGWSVSSATADITQGGRVVDTQDVTSNSNYFYCPNLFGVGRFTVGGSTQVAAYDDQYNSALFTDATSTSFLARYLSRVTLTVARSGSKVTLTSRTSRFSLDMANFNAYVTWNAPKTQVQYLSGTSWVPLKNLTPVAGKAVWSYTSATARSYRVVTSGSSTVAGRTSAVVRR